MSNLSVISVTKVFKVVPPGITERSDSAPSGGASYEAWHVRDLSSPYRISSWLHTVLAQYAPLFR